MARADHGDLDEEIAAALRFCCEDPAAVVLTLWPSGCGCTAMAREYLEECGAKVLLEREVPVARHAAVLVVRALYHGEEWLDTNCWYDEQPLEDGPPSGPHAGAQWKRALCFKVSTDNDDDGCCFRMRVFVVDAKFAQSLWSKKYGVRAAMARKSGNPGNSCMHITDFQGKALDGSTRRGSAGGYTCDESYAFHCGRCLLLPSSLHFLNSTCAEFPGCAEGLVWSSYMDWLSDKERLEPFQAVETRTGSSKA